MATHLTAQRFLSELFAPYPADSNLSCEIRCLVDGESYQDWFPIESQYLERAAHHAYDCRDQGDVYFGVLPRDGRGGAAIHVQYAAWLWVDIDAGTGTGADCMDLLRKAGLPKPYMAVMSGSGGGHIYWKLARRIRLNDANDRARFTAILRRLVRAIGGNAPGAHADKSAADVARVLRVPSTFNHKFDNPREVKLVMFDGGATERVWWEAWLPVEPVISDKAVQYASRPYTEDMDRKMTGLRNWAEKGYPEGNRHHDLTGAAAWLVREVGVNKNDAFDLLKVKAAKSAGKRQITEREIKKMVLWA